MRKNEEREWLLKYNETLQSFKEKISEIELPAEIRSRIEQLFTDVARKCDKCDVVIATQENFSNAGISANVSWGYESIGKDTDHDRWHLCGACSEEFKQKFHLVCGGCRRTILDVAATLHSRNQNSSFYGRYDAALAHFQGSNHCGLEYADIAGVILCEICYESFILTFKNPVHKDHYHPGNGDIATSKEVHTENRVDRGLSRWNPENSIILAWDDVLAARTDEDAAQRIVEISYREERKESCAYLAARGHDVRPGLVFQTGDVQYHSIKLEELAAELKGLMGIDLPPSHEGFLLLSLESDGRTIKIKTLEGHKSLPTITLLEFCKKHEKPESD